MEKIKQRNKDGITWYDNEDIVDKVHELVEEYNHYMATHEHIDKR